MSPNGKIKTSKKTHWAYCSPAVALSDISPVHANWLVQQQLQQYLRCFRDPLLSCLGRVFYSGRIWETKVFIIYFIIWTCLTLTCNKSQVRQAACVKYNHLLKWQLSGHKTNYLYQSRWDSLESSPELSISVFTYVCLSVLSADVLAQALDSLHTEMMSEECRGLFIRYGGVCVLLWIIRAGRGGLNTPVDILMQLTEQSRK